MSAPLRPGAGPLSAPVVLLKTSTAPVSCDDLACAPRETARRRVRACSTEVLRTCNRWLIALALAAAMSAMVFGSETLTSRFGKRRVLAGCSPWLVTPAPFVCMADRTLSPALSTFCESEAAIRIAIATTKTRGIGFLVKRGEIKDIKSSLVMVFRRLVAYDRCPTAGHEE